MSKKLLASVIVTVLNESKTISDLLEALRKQTFQPYEVVIVDGGSDDRTVELIQLYKKQHAKFNLHFFVKKGNRSVGRNLAIEKATSEVIACTDAGCIPEQTWLAELVDCYIESNAPVVAGYYKGNAKNNFQKAVIPYALVMPDKIHKNIFLPATRSMLFEKNIWSKVGKFNEYFCDNEDYAFAKQIEKEYIEISFTEKAIVKWSPPKTLFQFWRMIFRFARGDIQAGIVRPKVVLIFLRYLILLFLTVWLFSRSTLATVLVILLSFFILYAIWSIVKNKKYVGNAWYWLPILQIVSDIAVIVGSLEGTVYLAARKTASNSNTNKQTNNN